MARSLAHHDSGRLLLTRHAYLFIEADLEAKTVFAAKENSRAKHATSIAESSKTQVSTRLLRH